MPLTEGWYYTIYEGAPKLSNKVVLIHGAGGSHLSWCKELRRLPGWRVLALDLPG
ncbi:MAG: alpha/beta hydrolase, partial [Anaerolineae bacterium]|nr:alpha/beta hydrolase [Anaerolineae bacterium]